MTVLPWVRLDSGMPENPKIGHVISQPGGYKAVFTYLCSLSYSGKHGTYGTIPKAALPFIHGTAKEAKMLVQAGLWKPGAAGWEIHDWDTYQPPEEYVNTRKEKARNAARARWAKEARSPKTAPAQHPSNHAPSIAPRYAPADARNTYRYPGYLSTPSHLSLYSFF